MWKPDNRRVACQNLAIGSGTAIGRRMVLAAVLVIAAVLVAACGDADSDGGSTEVSADCKPKYKVQGTDETLRVGAIQYPPYSSIEDGEAGGIDGDIVRGFAEAACLNLEVSETTFAAAVSSVTSGRTDIAMGDLYRTRERADEVSLSAPVYLDQLGIVSRDGFDSIESLEGQAVATVQGYYFVDSVTEVFGDDLQLFPDNIKMYQDLFAGRTNAGLDSYPAAVEYLESRNMSDAFQVKVPPVDPRVPATGTDAAQSAYAFSDEVAGLGEGLNAYVKDIRASGELGQILADNGIPESAAEVGKPRFIE